MHTGWINQVLDYLAEGLRWVASGGKARDQVTRNNEFQTTARRLNPSVRPEGSMLQQRWSFLLALVVASWLVAILKQWQLFFWQVVPPLATALEAKGRVLHPLLQTVIDLYLISRWPLGIASIIVLGISLSSRRWARPVLYIALSAVALIQLLSSVFFVFASTQVVVVFRELANTP